MTQSFTFLSFLCFLSAATTGIPPPPPCGTLPPPPPPPPPPPLPPPFSLQRTFSVIDLIKERRGLKTDSQKVLDSKSAEIPSMLDVLKDMSKIKLRSVKRYLNRESTRIHSDTCRNELVGGVYGIVSVHYSHEVYCYRFNPSLDIFASCTASYI